MVMIMTMVMVMMTMVGDKDDYEDDNGYKKAMMIMIATFGPPMSCSTHRGQRGFPPA